jgi:predicted amidophosphoribosyltransferase
MASMQAINAYIVRYDIKTRIEEDPTSKVCEFCENTYKGAEPVCKKCLLDMKFRLRRLSCLLNEEDVRKVYAEPIVL